MPAKKPQNERLDYILKLRLRSGLLAVMEECRKRKGYETIAEWVRGLIHDECDAMIQKPSLKDELGF